MLCFVANDIDDIVDRDATENAVILINDRCRQQVPVLEFPDNLVGRRVRRDWHQVGRHHLGDHVVRIVRQQSRKKQRPDVGIVSTDNKDRIRAVGNLPDYPQIAGDNFKRDVRTHRHDVDIHQPAGAFLVVCENLLEAFVILLVE
jgi:hypothetical protein